MYTGYIVYKDQTAEDERVAKAIKNLGLSGQDVICIAKYGYVGELESFPSAMNILNDPSVTTIEEAMERLIETRNAQPSEE